ncbi:MAG: type IV pilin protein [Halomonas sp.]|uniref:type IV pilin protein n=1 Tax=Halomonas sp. TaxID=1486246 RepID=UPI003F90D415
MSYAPHYSTSRFPLSGQLGFTLIELMTVVAIIGVIAFIAYPGYTRYVQQSVRMDAHAGLMQAASELERCYSRTYSYHDCVIAELSPDQHYAIALTPHNSGYMLTASSPKEDGCAEDLRLNARGERLPNACW